MFICSLVKVIKVDICRTGVQKYLPIHTQKCDPNMTHNSKHITQNSLQYYVYMFKYIMLYIWI